MSDLIIYFETQLSVVIDTETRQVRGVRIDRGKVEETIPKVDRIDDDILDVCYEAIAYLGIVSSNVTTADGKVILVR